MPAGSEDTRQSISLGPRERGQVKPSQSPDAVLTPDPDTRYLQKRPLVSSTRPARRGITKPVAHNAGLLAGGGTVDPLDFLGSGGGGATTRNMCSSIQPRHLAVSQSSETTHSTILSSR
ncbi:hypothetical protein JHW43_006794 [Diplocarpon mali]|nr:hypothetical protein JHW43_006794 [Diplocarpon mali]